MTKFMITLLATAVVAAAPASAALHTVNFTGNFTNVESQIFTLADTMSLSVTFNDSNLSSQNFEGRLYEVTGPGAAFNITVGTQSWTLADSIPLFLAFPAIGITVTGEYIPFFAGVNAAGAVVATPFYVEGGFIGQNTFVVADNFSAEGLNGIGVRNSQSVSGAVPEPASWAMLIAGFGLTGAAMRRRRTAVAIA